jgi:hypothetical protein
MVKILNYLEFNAALLVKVASPRKKAKWLRHSKLLRRAMRLRHQK